MRGWFLRVSVAVAILFAFSCGANAQFKEEAFNQTYNDPADTTAASDSVGKMWSFKEFFRGVGHKEPLRIGSMFAGSTVFIGAEQIYNRQYWKLPVIYGGLGATIGLGVHYNNEFKSSGDQKHKDLSTYMFAGAGLIYWATLMDGVYNYKRDIPHQPGKATLYSIMLPGLGQAYNGEYWKIPVYWGLIIGSYHYWNKFNTNYQRYKRIHNEATDPEGNYEGEIPAERALYYRNVYRRYRDYSVVALVGSYLLQIIDANVFSYMGDFEVSDDLSLNVSPAVISPYNDYAFNPGTGHGTPPVPGMSGCAMGLRIGFTF